MIKKTSDSEHQLTIFNCSGELTRRELFNTILSFLKGTPTHNSLWDLTSARYLSISIEDVRDISFIARKYGSSRQGGKTALVAIKDHE